MSLNLGSGAHPLDGFENRDLAYDGWSFEDGLDQYDDESVEGITVSHALMHVPLDAWPFVFAEFARVLEVRGVVRITEDATDDPESERYGGFDGAVTLTSRGLVCKHLRAAGLSPFSWPDGSDTIFRDRSLIQEHHGRVPKVFHVEAIKCC